MLHIKKIQEFPKNKVYNILNFYLFAGTNSPLNKATKKGKKTKEAAEQPQGNIPQEAEPPCNENASTSTIAT
jgi:hypothetical protein